MKKVKLFQMPNSRFYNPISSIRRILNCENVETYVEEYNNTFLGLNRAKSKFEAIKEYLDNEQYSQTEKIIILKENFPTNFGQGQINKTQDYIEWLKRLDDPFGLIGEYEKTIIGLIGEYEKTIIEIKIAQSQLDSLISQEIEKLSPKPKIDQKSKVTIPKIALKLFYEGKKMNREEANEIIKEYGMNSGEKLYQKFCFYYEKTNRMAIPDPFTKKKLLNKIALFESVIKMLPINNQQKAIDELETIKSKGGKEFQ